MQPTEKIEYLLSKLRNLSAPRISEVEDFIDFLNKRDQDGTSGQEALRISAPTLTKIWNNTDDAGYDAL